ncbi:MAG TPA: DUF5063 domain-containing protein [Woeseiaceae bacterium]|nr:DUF5063 domain-containing protein [Woeseiaceae bacterium]
MKPPEIRNAIRDYLNLVESTDGSTEDAESRLVPVLDRLALAQSFVSFTFDETDYPDSPDQNYDDLRKLVSKRFPNYGYYNVADPITSNIGEAGASVGDAIDDLADIARDLYDVEWYWANTSEANALFHLQQSYRTHWRRHLREFQVYLDALELDRDLSV